MATVTCFNLVFRRCQRELSNRPRCEPGRQQIPQRTLKRFREGMFSRGSLNTRTPRCKYWFPPTSTYARIEHVPHTRVPNGFRKRVLATGFTNAGLDRRTCPNVLQTEKLDCSSELCKVGERHACEAMGQAWGWELHAGLPQESAEAVRVSLERCLTATADTP